MSFGERLYNLRKEKNISQGELADLLDVSRQSVSKWENNISTPDLDKIIKLAEIFNISIDSLINGYQASCDQDDKTVKTKQEHVNANSTSKTGRMLAGIIFLSLGLLIFILISVFVGILVGLEASLPFFACACICFIFKSHTWLWCAWVVHEVISIYILNSASISSDLIYLTFTSSLNPHQVIISWILLAFMGFMMALTVFTVYKKPLKVKLSHLIALTCIAVGIYLIIPIIYQPFVLKVSSLHFNSPIYMQLLNLLSYTIDRIEFYFAVVVVCYLARVIYPSIE